MQSKRLRELGCDASCGFRVTERTEPYHVMARKQYLLEKWAAHADLSTGPLEVIRRMQLSL